jgi:hypothetical protein
MGVNQPTRLAFPEATMINQIIVHFQDGRVIGGQTMDFLPAKERFHLLPSAPSAGGKTVEIKVADLKGIFFVKSLEGDRNRKDDDVFMLDSALPGRKVRVVFKDLEILQGYAQVYQPGRPGFFLIPVDKHSNNERIYVVTAATKEITVLPA